MDSLRRRTNSSAGPSYPNKSNGNTNLLLLLDEQTHTKADSDHTHDKDRRHKHRRTRSRHLNLLRILILLILSVLLLSIFLQHRRTAGGERARSSSSFSRCFRTLPAKPVIEFYLHGRGSGHWTGSWGLMEVLIQQGYDLRVYATKPMPPSTSQTNLRILRKLLEQARNNNNNNTSHQSPTIGTDAKVRDPPLVNYTLVDAIMPGMEYTPWRIVWILLCRLIRWGVRGRTKPLLVISDGDFCGAFSAFLYNIPSLYITHGQMFAAAPPPASLPQSLIRSWQQQASLNGRSSQFTNYAIGFTHVPSVPTKTATSAKMGKDSQEPPIRPRIRNVVQTMSCQRAQRLQHYHHQHHAIGAALPSSPRHNPLVATYFRDSNGHTIIEMLVQEGMDVVVFGSYPHLSSQQNYPGSIIPISDATHFVQFMGIADGVVASAGCILQAECVYAQIPMLALFQQHDTEHELNVYLSQQLRYHDGRRLLYGMSFEELAAAAAAYNDNGTKSMSPPSEVQLFLADVRNSDASASFYEETSKEEDSSYSDRPPCTSYSHELIDGAKESSDAVLSLLETVKQNAICQK